MWEEAAPPGSGPPRHIHLRMDEAFQILEGHYEVWCDGRIYELGPGAMAMIPKGTPHTFRCMGPAHGRMLTTVVPGGLDDFFIEIETRGFKLPDDLEQLVALGKQLRPRIHRPAARRLSARSGPRHEALQGERQRKAGDREPGDAQVAPAPAISTASSSEMPAIRLTTARGTSPGCRRRRNQSATPTQSDEGERQNRCGRAVERLGERRRPAARRGTASGHRLRTSPSVSCLAT